MATRIETLKKPNGDQVLPRTRAKAVSMEDGASVEAVIVEINTAISAIEDSIVEQEQVQSMINEAIANLPIYEGTYREIYTGETEEV